MAAILLLGAFFGVLAGARWQLMHRAWQDWRRAVAGIPGLRRAFYRHFRWSVLLVVGALLALWLHVMTTPLSKRDISPTSR